MLEKPENTYTTIVSIYLPRCFSSDRPKTTGLLRELFAGSAVSWSRDDHVLRPYIIFPSPCLVTAEYDLPPKILCQLSLLRSRIHQARVLKIENPDYRKPIDLEEVGRSLVGGGWDEIPYEEPPEVDWSASLGLQDWRASIPRELSDYNRPVSDRDPEWE
jgi:hypothetical protein